MVETEPQPTDIPDALPSAPRNRLRWEWVAALLLVAGILLLTHKAREKDREVRSLQNASLQASLSQYRQLVAPMI